MYRLGYKRISKAINNNVLKSSYTNKFHVMTQVPKTFKGTKQQFVLFNNNQTT